MCGILMLPISMHTDVVGVGTVHIPKLLRICYVEHYHI